MSKWITDRLPTEEDCAGVKGTRYEMQVWVNVLDTVVTLDFFHVRPGVVWHPIVIEKPELYKAPLRYTVVPSAFRDGEWVVEYDKMLIADKIPTREAAERIAAIYNEVMP